MPNGRLETSRPTFVNVWEYLGYSPGESPSDFGSAMTLAVHPDDRDVVVQAMRSRIDGQSQEFEATYRVRRKDGSERWNLSRGVVQRDGDGRPLRFTGASVDITALKHVEAELHEARTAAEAANRAKDEFLANVSHEIRTPMNAILGMTELTLEQPTSEHQRQLLRTVKSAAESLLVVINDLLDFSKIEAGRLELESGRVHPAFGLRGHRARPGAACSPQGAGARVRRVVRPARPARRRRGAPAPGSPERCRERRQVHGSGRGSGLRLRERARAGVESDGLAARHRSGHGNRDLAREAAEDIPRVRAGG